MKQLYKNQLSSRQEYILQFLEKSPREQSGNRHIFEAIQKELGSISRITVIRDLTDLIKRNLIKRHGKGRSVQYVVTARAYLKRIHPEEYFQTEPDKRTIQADYIDFSGGKIADIFEGEELQKLKILTQDYQKRLKKYQSRTEKNIFKKELERITIEFSWKSSRIEGNTYSLLDTERLIKEHEEASGKTHEEAMMILNHKNALEYIWKYPKHFEKISPQKIVEFHTLITQKLHIETGFRKRAVGIIGTKYRPYDNQFQIREAIEKLCKRINEIKNPFEKALIAVAGISYIQPFEDGNKRTSRILGNAILIANTCCPLSYRSIDEIEYKKAVILFYEQHTLEYFKKLFIDQYTFAVQNYFL